VQSRRPETDASDVDGFADCTLKHVRHLFERFVDVDRSGTQGLAARQCEQPMRDAGRACRCILCPDQSPPRCWRQIAPPDEFEITADHTEDVVKIVGDPSRQLAYGVELLVVQDDSAAFFSVRS
jgi:hypothetical protein